MRAPIRAPAPVQRFESPVGNNDVPYPYAVGGAHTYLMVEDVCVPTAAWAGQHEDPYDFLYAWRCKDACGGTPPGSRACWRACEAGPRRLARRLRVRTLHGRVD